MAESESGLKLRLTKKMISQIYWSLLEFVYVGEIRNVAITGRKSRTQWYFFCSVHGHVGLILQHNYRTKFHEEQILGVVSFIKRKASEGYFERLPIVCYYQLNSILSVIDKLLFYRGIENGSAMPTGCAVYITVNHQACKLICADEITHPNAAVYQLTSPLQERSLSRVEA